MSRPIDILFAIPALDHGGPDRVLFEILCALDRRRFRPRLVVNEPTGYYLAKVPADVPIDVLGSERTTLDRYPVVKALRTVWRIKPDLVFATLRMIQTMGAASPLFPRTTRLVLRQANHASQDFEGLIKARRWKHTISREVTLATLRQADAIVCQSEVMRADLAQLLGNAVPLHTIGNPIDVDAVTNASRDGAAPRGTPALISVGRLMSQKGYDIMLRALPTIRARHPGVHVTVLGDGPDRAGLDQLARELGVAETITFAGFDPEPLPKVGAADLFVLASRYEGFPNAALEALACGTPVVLTNCPGANAQIVSPGINGRIADAVTPEAFSAAMLQAIGELAAYDRARITEDTRVRFGAAAIVGAYEGVFTTVLADTPRGRGRRAEPPVTTSSGTVPKPVPE